MTPRLPKYLTQDELTRFFAVIPSPGDRALFALIYHRPHAGTSLSLHTPRATGSHTCWTTWPTILTPGA
jgi:hypothetical protein